MTAIARRRRAARAVAATHVARGRVGRARQVARSPPARPGQRAGRRGRGHARRDARCGDGRASRQVRSAGGSDDRPKTRRGRRRRGASLSARTGPPGPPTRPQAPMRARGGPRGLIRPKLTPAEPAADGSRTLPQMPAPSPPDKPTTVAAAEPAAAAARSHRQTAAPAAGLGRRRAHARAGQRRHRPRGGLPVGVPEGEVTGLGQGVWRLQQHGLRPAGVPRPRARRLPQAQPGVQGGARTGSSPGSI